MLGLARAAQYAGWGVIKPSFVSDSTVSVAGVPSWDGFTSLQVNNWNSPQNGDNLTGTAFDATGIVSGNKATHVMTYRVKTASNYTFQSDGFTTGYELLAPSPPNLTQYCPFFVYVNDATAQFIGVINPKLAKHTASGDLAFLMDWGNYNILRMTGVTWDSLADRWITVVSSVSTTQSDFANHNPPETFGSLYGRITIVDAATEELIKVQDFRVSQFNYVITDAADRTWRYRSQSGDSATAWLLTQVRTGTDLSGDDILVAGGWAAVNQMIDPTATTDGRPVWQWFVGQNFPETVAGVRAWVNFSSKTASAYDAFVTEVTFMGPGRVSTTGSVWARQDTTSLATPITNSSRP